MTDQRKSNWTKRVPLLSGIVATGIVVFWVVIWMAGFAQKWPAATVPEADMAAGSSIWTGLSAMALILILSYLVWRSADSLSKYWQFRAQSERELRESRSRLATAVEIAQLGLWEFDSSSGAIQIDVRFQEMFGVIGKETISIEALRSMIHPADRTMVDAHVHLASDPLGAGRFETEHRIIRPDGIERWISVRGRAVGTETNKDGRRVRFVGTVMDITVPRSAAEELQTERNKFQAVFEALDAGVMVADGTGRILDMNPAALKLHGIPSLTEAPLEPEYFRRRFELQLLTGELVPPDQRPAVRALKGDYYKNLELLTLDRDTVRKWVGSWSVSVMRDHNGVV